MGKIKEWKIISPDKSQAINPENDTDNKTL